MNIAEYQAIMGAGGDGIMKKLSNLPRRTRERVGIIVLLISLILIILLSDTEEYRLLLSIAPVMFFAWLCPELWSGQ